MQDPHALAKASARPVQFKYPKWDITSDVFNRSATRFEIDEALRILHSQKLAFRTEEKTSTKPAERWFYREKPYEQYEESPTKTG